MTLPPSIDWLPLSKSGWHDLGIVGVVLGALAVGYLAGRWL
jgi:hypothetical protein